MGNEIACHVLRIHEIGHAELAAPALAVRVDVHAHDLISAHQLQALDHVEADTAEAKDDAARTGFHLCGLHHRAHARGDTATDVAGLVERRVGADFRHGDFRQHGEVRKGRAAHVVENRLTLVAEARRAIGHQPLALRGADGGAQVGLAGKAAFALAAFRRVERDHVIARCHAAHPGTNLAHDAGAFMAQDRREYALAVLAFQRVGIGMADAGGHDFHQHFAGLRAFQVNLDDFERQVGRESDGGAAFHDNIP